MGLSSLLGLGSATERILSRYGTRSGTIINATGTGTQLIISPAEDYHSYVRQYFPEVFDEDNNLYITAFSPNGQPVRPQVMSVGGVKRSLTGKIYAYRSMSPIEISVTVIGNSLDYYRLAMLSTAYTKSRNYHSYYTDTQTIPLINMQIVSNSAPGASVILRNGIMTDADNIMGVDGTSKISDKIFTFQFESMSTPSWSKQKYDPVNGPNILEDLLGI